jgi:hypothetical protein
VLVCVCAFVFPGCRCFQKEWMRLDLH